MLNLNLKKILEKNEIEVSEKEHDSLDIFKHLVLEFNKRVNLTKITDDEDFNVKHFLDSLILFKFYPKIEFKNKTVVDVGTGAGIPGIPLAIFLPDTKFSLVDSNRKKINLLNLIISELKLNNVEAIYSKAEKLPKEKYDFAISRGFCGVEKNLKILAPLVKVNGKIILYKTPKENEIISKNEDKLIFLGLQDLKITNFILNETYSRTFLEFSKIKKVENLEIKFIE